jgi:glycolate oxidase iron-sulfur subunit
VRDASEFLAERGIEPPVKTMDMRVAYDAPCHLLHAQKISSAPVNLLGKIPGLKVGLLDGYENCCGGAGLYNLQQTELSGEILKEKVDAIRESGADAVATSNPGCIMQIGAGLLLGGQKVDVLHPIELLDAAYDLDPAS